MNLLLRDLLACIALCVLIGCAPTEESLKSPAISQDTQPAPVEETTYHLNHAQPKLPTMRLFMRDKTVVAELALSLREIATGMMFRESMGDDEGMLFVFNSPHQTSFYMKNTKVPLTGAYVGADGRILELHDMQPLNETSIPAKDANVQFVLEMPQGWFAQHGIDVGTLITTEKGPLVETFFGR